MLEIIKEYRIRADLTYEELAEKIGVILETLQKNLTGFTNPNERTVFKYSEFIRTHKEEIERVLGRELSEV